MALVTFNIGDKIKFCYNKKSNQQMELRHVEVLGIDALYIYGKDLDSIPPDDIKTFLLSRMYNVKIDSDHSESNAIPFAEARKMIAAKVESLSGEELAKLYQQVVEPKKNIQFDRLNETLISTNDIIVHPNNCGCTLEVVTLSKTTTIIRIDIPAKKVYDYANKELTCESLRDLLNN